MSTHRITGKVDGQPIFDKPLDLSVTEVGGAVKILSPLEYHTDRQRRWYKGRCLKGLSDWSGESPEWWDREIKKRCSGLELLKKEVFLTDNGCPIGRLTTKGVGKRNMTLFIQEILSTAIKMEWPVTPPDPELRS